MISHALLLVSSLALVLGHGRVTQPPSRASAWRYDFPTPANYDDDGLNCGGFATQWSSNGGKCGICGDAYNIPTPRPHELGGTYGLGIIVAKYLPGATIATTTHLTASHMGYWEFKLCPDPTDNSQECFDRHPLTLENGDTKYTPNRGSGIYNVNYKLPSGLICDHCVLQWRYVAGNNWGICSNGSSGLGCGNQEEFRACSDVAIGMSKTLSDESLANEIPSPLFFYLQNGYFELDQGYLIQQDPKRPTRPQRPPKPINSKRQPKVAKQETNTPQRQPTPPKQQPNSYQQLNTFLRQPTGPNQQHNNFQQQQPNSSNRQPTPSKQELNYFEQQLNPFQQQLALSKLNYLQQQANLSIRQPATSKQQPNNYHQQFTTSKQQPNSFQQQPNSLGKSSTKQHPNYIQQQPTFSKQPNSSQGQPNHSKQHPKSSQRQQQLNYNRGQNKLSKKQNSGRRAKPAKQQLKSQRQSKPSKQQPTSSQYNASGKQRKQQKSRNKKKKAHRENQKINHNTRSQRYNYL